MTRRGVLAALVLVVIACGKRGDPRPPVPVIPQPTSDLVVTQRADKVILSWSYPSLTTTGRSLPAVRRISVYRYIEELPVSAFERDAALPGEIEPSLPRAYASFRSIPALPKTQFEKLSTRLESIEGANLDSATAGSRLIFTDTPPFRTADGRPVRLSYAVVTESTSARSEMSNLATIVPLPVAIPPTAVVATPAAEGVVLSWERPAVAVGTGEAPVIVGYHVYRTVPGEALSELAPPISVAPVTATTYTDTPPYGEHEYRITAVASPGPPAIQSATSAPVRVTFKDLVPPPVPTNLVPLIETNAIRLQWDPVDAPDLAGYRVYRSEGVGHVNIIDVGTIPLHGQPITETTFLDTDVNLGIAFRYAVSAVDTSGNESGRIQTEWIVAPKTP
jgi:hypothetical protein